MVYSLPSEYRCYRFKASEDPERFRQAWLFWREVWQHESGQIVDNCEWKDDIESSIQCWLILNGECIVAVARVSIHDRFETLLDLDFYCKFPEWNNAKKSLTLPVAALTRLAVRSDFRGRGVANFLDRERIAWAKEMGAASTVTTVNTHRMQSLRKFGFQDLTQPQPHSKLTHLQSSDCVFNIELVVAGLRFDRAN